MSSLAIEAAALDLVRDGDDPQRVQRRLTKGLCARCGHPVAAPAKGRRRSTLCPACWETHGWCSRGQHARPRAEFARLAASPHGIGYECEACRKGRQILKPRPLCARCSRNPVAGVRARAKLCAACLETHAWCVRCGVRPRTAFRSTIARSSRTSGLCRRCDRVPAAENRMTARRKEQAAVRAAAVVDALAHPDDALTIVAARHGLSPATLCEAMRAAGVGREAARAAAARERWELARTLKPAALAERLGITRKQASSLRARAMAAARREERNG